MPRIVEEMVIDRVALVDYGADQHATIEFFKRRQKTEPGAPGSDAPPAREETGDSMTKNMTALPEALSKSLTDAKVELPDEAVTAIAEAIAAASATAPATPEVDEFKKGLSPEARTRFEEVEKSNTEMRARLEEEIEKSAISRVTEDVTKNLNALPGQPGETGALLYRIEKSIAPEDMTALRALLVAGNEAMGRVVGNEVGTSSTTDQGDSSIGEDLEKRAQEIKTANPMFTIEKARSMAIQENPKAYDNHVEEMRKRRG